MKRLAIVLLALHLAGCATLPKPKRPAHPAYAEYHAPMMPEKRAAFIFTIADAASTAYGLTQHGNLREAGIVLTFGDDKTAILTNALVTGLAVLVVHKLHRRRPDWRGWRHVFRGVAMVKAGATAHNVKLISEQP